MIKAYKYRLFPNEEQQVLIEKHFGCTRYVYNYALNKRIEFYKKEGKKIHRFELQAELPKLKKQEDTKWLAEVNAHSLQATLINLDSAYVRFFREKKGFPKFKSKHNSKQSYQIPPSVTTNVDFNDKINEMNVPFTVYVADKVVS